MYFWQCFIMSYKPLAFLNETDRLYCYCNDNVKGQIRLTYNMSLVCVPQLCSHVDLMSSSVVTDPASMAPNSVIKFMTVQTTAMKRAVSTVSGRWHANNLLHSCVTSIFPYIMEELRCGFLSIFHSLLAEQFISFMHLIHPKKSIQLQR